MSNDEIVSIVGVCDSILYKAISGVLMPTVLQALPDSLTQVIRKFAKQLDEWLKVALHDLPENLRTIKFELYQEFDHLLEEQSPIESYIEWLDSMVDSCVVKVAGKIPGSLKKVAQQFLLMWSCFGTRVIRDMTLHSAPSFGSFHLIHLMFDDYVLYVLESLHCQERANELMRAMKAEGSTADRGEEIMLTEPTPPSPSPGPYSPAKSVTSAEITSAPSPGDSHSPEYTVVTTTSVTTAGNNPSDAGQQLPCMRSSQLPPSSSTHRMPVYPHREEHGYVRYTGGYNYGSYSNQHHHPIQSQYTGLPHEPGITAPLHYPAYHRSTSQYPLNSQMSRMEPCLMSGTPRLHPTPVTPRWPDVPSANNCYTSPPMHSSRYSSDMYTPLAPRRNSEYEHVQHFPGFAYINGEATTGWAK
ncbi:Transcription factor RFX4 [Acipenser ruthenus]|uniref:Transcription factor RFX4 n=1 Tax=Acipenser ruthenus TaxID=7906 RepID=A0A444UDX5_ACIRT|nr:Transcription factor RFX4 [Acipenser ruthenus]